MLGRLARWLRILGVDAVYVGSLSDEEIAERLGPGDILFTRDKELARRLKSRDVRAVVVPQDFEKALLVATRVLGVALEVDMDKTRCPLCGGRLREVDASEVAGRVPPRILEYYDKFYVCERCGHIYWVGTHMREIEDTLRRIRGMSGGGEANARGGPLPSKAREKGG